MSLSNCLLREGKQLAMKLALHRTCHLHPHNEPCSLLPNTARSVGPLLSHHLPPLRPVLLEAKDPDSSHTLPTA